MNVLYRSNETAGGDGQIGFFHVFFYDVSITLTTLTTLTNGDRSRRLAGLIGSLRLACFFGSSQPLLASFFPALLPSGPYKTPVLPPSSPILPPLCFDFLPSLPCMLFRLASNLSGPGSATLVNFSLLPLLSSW